MRIVRYTPELHGVTFLHVFQDEAYRDFFRRIPFGLNVKQIVYDFEDISRGQLYAVEHDNQIIGFAVTTQTCDFGRSCHAGLVLLQQFQKKKIGDYGLAFLALFELAKQLFEYSNIRKIKLMILESNKALKSILDKAGLQYEGTFIENVEFRGKWQNELEYALFRELYWFYKEKVNYVC